MKDGDAIETKAVGNQLHQLLSNTRDAQPTIRLTLNGSHWYVVAIAVDFMKQIQVRVHIHHQAKAGDTISYRRAEMNDSPPIGSNPRPIRVDDALDVEFAQ
jgi:hypothetical protein